MHDEGKLVVEIKNKNPVELLDLTQALVCFAREFQNFADAALDGPYASTRLYVKEIRTGSIITELIPYAPGLLPLLSDTNTVVAFAERLRKGVNWLLRPDVEPKPEPPMDKPALENMWKIVEPIAKDSASQLNINAQNVQIHINSAQANAIQNEAQRQAEILKAPTVGLHTNVVMHWWQARNDPSSQAGDRAIIESIWPKPVRVIFEREQIKADMLQIEENLFAHGFRIDVQVETIRNLPVLYKVVALHEGLTESFLAGAESALNQTR